ncbi:MAG: type 1 glutamine amidotransferase [Candidatus Dormibacteria bacterium]
MGPPRLVVVEHVENEGPGLIAQVADECGMNIRRVGASDPLPDLDPATALVVMGGPMSVCDGEPRLGAEVALLHDALTRGLPVLGVCLGAQLLASACGARVYHGERGQEVGLGSVTLTVPARDDPLFAGCGESLDVLHWHGDTFDLPRGACHLASSELYPNQGFRMGCAYALQFHLEVDAALLLDWSPQIGSPPDPAAWLRRTEGERAGILRRWAEQAVRILAG